MATDPDSVLRTDAEQSCGGSASRSAGDPPVPQQPVIGAAPTHHISSFPGEAERGQLDLRRQAHIVRKRLVWVVLIALVSTGVSAFIGANRKVPWRAELRLIVRRDAFLRVSPDLSAVLSEELIPAGVRTSVALQPETAELQGEASFSVKTEGLQVVHIVTEGREGSAVEDLAKQILSAFNKWFASQLARETIDLAKRKAKRENELAGLAGDLRIVLKTAQRLDAIQARYDEEELNRETIAGRLARLQEAGAGNGPERLEPTTALKRQRIIEQIVELEMQQVDMKIRYTSIHPRLQSVNSKLEQLTSELEKLLPSETRLGSTRDAQVSLLDSDAKLRVLRKHVEEAKKSSTTTEKNEVQLQMRKTMLHQEILAMGERLARLNAVRAVAPLREAGPVEVIQPPGLMAKVLHMAPFGLILGMVMGVLFALMMEYLRDTCSSPGEVYTDLKLPTLGAIPRIPSDKERLISLDKPHSDLAEMFGILRNNLRYSSPNDPQKLILITSPLPGEGKSLLTTNLAISYTFEGLTVLLVDADMRRSRGHLELDPAPGAEGLVAWLEGRLASPEQAAVSTAVSGLDLVPAGGKAGNATKLLSNAKMIELFRWAESQYDVVILDTPAVLPVADTTIFAQQARAVMVVIDANSTRASAARAAVSRLAHVRSNLVGVVLNRVDQKAMGYMSYYGTGYGYRHGYG